MKKKKKKGTPKGFMNIILKAIKNQKCIHVGSCGRGAKLKRHPHFKKAAPKIIGFDINEKDVEIANELGYTEIFHADATNPKDMEEIVEKYGTFPHVLMPEVIEHVPNVGLLLEGCKILMGKKGKLYITTPNVWRCDEELRINNDHVCWYCKRTLGTLIRRHNMYIEEMHELGKTLCVIARRNK